MKKRKSSLIIGLLLMFNVTLLTPAVPVAAAALTDLGSPTVSDGGGSGNLFDLLLGLLLGKFFPTMSAPGNSNFLSAPGTGSQQPGSDVNNGRAITATAQKYMGVPYIWGGETPTGFDCSGFTRYVMSQNGIKIPRTAAEQYAAGTPVAKNNLKAGDLVFFSTYKAGASHVGFYLGDGKFIHASSLANQVTISELADQYYTDHYIGARRYPN